MALSGATIPCQSGSGSSGNEGVLCIPQSPSITGTSHHQIVNVRSRKLVGGVLPLCRGAVGIFYSSRRAGWLVFPGLSTLVGYVMPNPTLYIIYIYI